MTRRAVVLRGAALAAAASLQAVPLQAHPMPDSKISIGRDTDHISLRIRVPAADLRLALAQPTPRDGTQLVARHQPLLRRYFATHTQIVTGGGSRVPLVIDSIRVHAAYDHHVGDFAQIEVRASARVATGIRLWLHYDAVLHRIANHRALVSDRAGRTIGVIRYSLATKRATPLPLP